MKSDAEKVEILTKALRELADTHASEVARRALAEVKKPEPLTVEQAMDVLKKKIWASSAGGVNFYSDDVQPILERLVRETEERVRAER